MRVSNAAISACAGSMPEEMTQLVMDLSCKTPYENKAVSLQEIPCDYALFAQYSLSLIHI